MAANNDKSKGKVDQQSQQESAKPIPAPIDAPNRVKVVEVEPDQISPRELNR